MKKQELCRRYLLFVISLFFSALGTAFTRQGALGVSPISSVANVCNLRFPALSMGTLLFFTNCVLLLGQILLLRRKFRPIQLVQLPLSILFGWFTDLTLWMVSPIPVERYLTQLILVVVGVVVLAFGISLAVIADVVMNSGEAFVKALADTLHRNFGNVKVVFDLGCVTLSILLSLLFFSGSIVGTREGTLIAACCTGFVVKFFAPRLRAPLERLLTR